VNETLRRVIVSVVGAPIAILLIWLGDAALATLLGALAAVAAWEFFRMVRESGVRPLSMLGIIVAALVPLGTHAQFLGVAHFTPVIVPITVLTIVAISIWARAVDERPMSAAATTVLGILYTGCTLSFAYALRYFNYAVGETAGALVVILPVLLTWSSDTGAFFAGRLIGGRKLMPSVSPAKTVSGALGAVVSTVAMCALFVHFGLRPYAQLAFSPWGLVLFAVGVSVSAQIGDLAESLFKREAGVKDSGGLFPGHGGVLDRLDSLFFVLPVSYALYGWLLLPAPQ
jgi:phosphatidate cytidylyltransferase